MTNNKSIRARKRSRTANGGVSDRHVTKQQLESAEFFRTLVENSLDAVAVVEPDGTIRYESPSVERVLGYKPEELIGRNALDFLHPEDVQRVTGNIATAKENPDRAFSAEVRFLHKDGTWRVLEGIGCNLLHDPNVNGIVTNYRDITERKQIEDTLLEREEKLRSLFDCAIDGIFAIDINGIYTQVNNRLVEMHGLSSPDEMLGQSCLNFVAKSDLEMAVTDLKGILEQGSVTGVEYSALKSDGTTFPCEVNAAVQKDAEDNPIGIIGIIRDITERKLSEEALREAERRYQAIFDNRLQMVYVINEAGVFVDANDCALQRLGYTRNDLGKISMVDVVHPDDLPKALESRAKIEATGRLEHPLEFRVIAKSGETIHVLIFGVPLDQGDGKRIAICIATDITESKLTEVQLRESEEKLKRYLDSSPDGIYISDARAIFLYGNRAAEKIVGYSRDELIGKSWLELDLLTEEDFTKAVPLFESNVAGIPTGPDEFKLIRKDGSHVFVEISTYPIGKGDNLEIIGIARDVTERKKMEQALRESEESLRALIENAPDSITVYDLEGTILDCNRRGEELCGYQREEMVGKSIFEIGVIPKDYVERAIQALEKNSFSQGNHPFEFDLLRKNGSRITLEATTITVEREGRTQIICISRDVTERKKAEEEKRRMEQQLQLAGRLAAVGELAAGVAHELNNPLAAVQAFAEYLAAKEGLDETIKSDVDTIYKEAKRATRITGNLLSFARKHNPEKSLISINDVIEQSLELHLYRMRVNNIDVLKNFDTDLPMTMADYHQMQQVFTNLITNAEQAMTEAHGKGKLVVSTESLGEMIRVTFTDDGPGIPEDNLKNLFDPFFTTKGVGEGTGLGLSICYGILQEHGGLIYAKSKIDEGTTFVIEIPIVTEIRAEEEATSTHYIQSVPRYM